MDGNKKKHLYIISYKLLVISFTVGTSYEHNKSREMYTSIQIFGDN